MMAEKCLSRVVIGASTLEDFEHQTELVSKVLSEEFPLDAITEANQKELLEKQQDGKNES